ncbi:unnamed protein product, partial [Iphiclides podalirius]
MERPARERLLTARNERMMLSCLAQSTPAKPAHLASITTPFSVTISGRLAPRDRKALRSQRFVYPRTRVDSRAATLKRPTALTVALALSRHSGRRRKGREM